MIRYRSCHNRQQQPSKTT